MAKILLIFMGWLAMRGQLVNTLSLATGKVNAKTEEKTEAKTEPKTNAKP